MWIEFVVSSVDRSADLKLFCSVWILLNTDPTVTSHLGDKTTGRQPTERHILVNWATEVETTGPQLWKCERLTIAILEQLCAAQGQRPFNITRQTNLMHSSLKCYEVAGLNDASQSSVNQTAQVVSQLISDLLPTISKYFNNDPLPKTINNRLLW